MITFDDVSFSYPDGTMALDGVSFTVDDGEKVGLLGLNGSGKSTLMLHCAALLLPDSGSVTVDNIRASKQTAAEIRRHVGIVFQNADDQLFMPTVEADVAFGPANMQLGADELKQRVDEALRATGTEILRNRAPFSLSGGQKKMVSVATVLSMRPSALILDEPTSGLDYSACDRLSTLLSTLPHTMLLSSHDVGLIKNLCSRAIVLNQGRVVFDGPVDHLQYP